MDVIENYISKYATIKFEVKSGGSLINQWLAVWQTCNKVNSQIKSDKKKLANALAMFMAGKLASEATELRYINKITELMAENHRLKEQIGARSEDRPPCKCKTLLRELHQLRQDNETLQEEVIKLDVEKDKLQDELDECYNRCLISEQLVRTVQSKLTTSVPAVAVGRPLPRECPIADKVGSQKVSPNRQVREEKASWDADTRVLAEAQGVTQDDLDISEDSSEDDNKVYLSLDDSTDLSKAGSPKSPKSLSAQSSCQLRALIGPWDASVPPELFMLRFEQVVKQFSLGNRDACHLLKVCLPPDVAAQLEGAALTDLGCDSEDDRHWANDTERLSELKKALQTPVIIDWDYVLKIKMGPNEPPISFAKRLHAAFKVVMRNDNLSKDDPLFLSFMASQIPQVTREFRPILSSATSFSHFMALLLIS
ncbi:posterior protein-like [Discoglossus pictus]